MPWNTCEKVYTKIFIKSIQTIKYCSDLIENWKFMAQCLITDVFFGYSIISLFTCFWDPSQNLWINPTRVIPQSCSEACVHPPGPRQTGLCTEAGRCHPATLDQRQTVSSQGWWLIKLFALSALHHVALVLLLITITDSFQSSYWLLHYVAMTHE